MIDYHSNHMVEYKPTLNRSFTSIEHLQFLKGRKWDEIALAYVHGLRPSFIRVTTGEVKNDHRLWRVTVYVDKNDIIMGVEQEVEIAPPIGMSGYQLDSLIAKERGQPLVGERR